MSGIIKKTIVWLSIVGIVIFVGVNAVHIYFQNQNIAKVLEQNLDGRLIPHKVNYKNKLRNILDDKIRSFEFDTMFNSSAKVPYFEIGHDISELDGESFENYLKLIGDRKMKKIWMDIKNVDGKNIDLILKRLNYLDTKYHIKEILIFETSSTLPNVKKISEAGYHTSYYLPTTGLNANPVIVDKEAKRIVKQIVTQKLKAISFPSSLYPFVKTKIEPKISQTIVYHTWNTYKFKRYNQLEKIQQKQFYKDKRVKTIIYSYFNNKPNRLLAWFE